MLYIIENNEHKKYLKDYACKNNAYNITPEEFNKIKKEKGISNIILENTIRNIEFILYSLNSD